MYGEAQLLLACAAALGECVLQPAKSMALLVLSKHTLKLSFFPLKASSPLSSQKCFLFPFPLSQHVGAYIFLLQKLCLSLAYILNGKAVKHSWTSLSLCMCKVWDRSSRHLSDVALRMHCFLGAALQMTPHSRAPTACDNQRSWWSHTVWQSSSSQSAANCFLLDLNSDFLVERGSLESGLWYEVFVQKWDERNVFLVKLMDYKR